MIKAKISFIPVMLLLAITVLAQNTSGWIGISVEDRNEGGVIVRSVVPNSPASRAGLKAGDIILQFNSQDVVGVRQLTRLIRETPVGRTVEFKIRRDNQDQIVQVATERLPDVPNDLSGLVPGLQG